MLDAVRMIHDLLGKLDANLRQVVKALRGVEVVADFETFSLSLTHHQDKHGIMLVHRALHRKFVSGVILMWCDEWFVCLKAAVSNE